MKNQEAIKEVLFDIERMTEADKEAVLQALVQKKYEKTLQERVSLEKRKFAGRPSRLQPEIIERFLVALRQGASLNMACKFAGISHDIFEIWSRKAREYQDVLLKTEKRRLECDVSGEKFKLTPYEKRVIEKPSKEVIDCIELFVLIDQAIAECGIRDLASITKAAQNGAWTAAAFRLSKRFPKEYGNDEERTQNVNVNVGFNYVEVTKAERPLMNPNIKDTVTDLTAARLIENQIIDVEAKEVS